MTYLEALKAIKKKWGSGSELSHTLVDILITQEEARVEKKEPMYPGEEYTFSNAGVLANGAILHDFTFRPWLGFNPST